MTRITVALLTFVVLVTCLLAAAHAQGDAGAAEPPAAPADAAAAKDAAQPATSGTAPATPAEAAEKDPVGTVTEMVNDIRAGNWRDAVVGALALLMFLLVRVRDKIKLFKGDRGGAILVMAFALVGSLSVALASEVPLDWRLFLGAATAAWTAAGAVKWFKQIIRPKDWQPVKP